MRKKDGSSGDVQLRGDNRVTRKETSAEVDNLLAVARATRALASVETKQSARRQNTRPRLLFAMDATMSRQPTWDAACVLQNEFFAVASEASGRARQGVKVSSAGAIEVQLAYFRGLSECRVTPWYTSSQPLRRAMQKVYCEAGLTQIERILRHAISLGAESAQDQRRLNPLTAMVYVGDSFEENVDTLAPLAAKLRAQNTTAFYCIEGADSLAARDFGQLARIGGGQVLPFDLNSSDKLRQWLSACAAWAVGGASSSERMDSLRHLTKRGHVGAGNLLALMNRGSSS